MERSDFNDLMRWLDARFPRDPFDPATEDALFDDLAKYQADSVKEVLWLLYRSNKRDGWRPSPADIVALCDEVAHLAHTSLPCLHLKRQHQEAAWWKPHGTVEALLDRVAPAAVGDDRDGWRFAPGLLHCLDCDDERPCNCQQCRQVKVDGPEVVVS